MNTSRAAAVLLGPPASGKSTLANTVAQQEDLVVVGVGPLLKERARSDTQLGRQLRPFVDHGQIAPTHLVEPVVREKLERHRRGDVIFDGFPRTEEQIDPFLRLIDQQHLQLRAAVILILSLEVAMERLNARLVCSACGAVYNLRTRPPQQSRTCDRCGERLIQRHDDEPAVLRHRFDVYERETQPVEEVFIREFPHQTYRQSAVLPVSQAARRLARRLCKERTFPMAIL